MSLSQTETTLSILALTGAREVSAKLSLGEDIELLKTNASPPFSSLDLG